MSNKIGGVLAFFAFFWYSSQALFGEGSLWLKHIFSLNKDFTQRSVTLFSFCRLLYMKRTSERLLLYKIISRRDTESYGELYDLYIEKIYRFIYFKVHNKEDAEDLSSEVFLRAWQYIIQKSPATIDSVSGLLFSIARNAVIDLYRKRAQKPTVSIEIVSEIVSENKELERVELAEESGRIIELIKKLKQDYQEVLILKYVEGLKTAEISRVLGKSALSVRVLLHRALKKLKNLQEEKVK